jgi:hypothetical protein
MLNHAQIDEIRNIADPKFRLSMMRDTVSAVQARGNLFYPLLNLVSTFIDGLVSAPRGETQVQYIAYLEKHFPELSEALGAKIFYKHDRCAAIHEFGLGNGYAIGLNDGMSGEYVAKQKIIETGQILTILNIERLTDDFLRHIDSLLSRVVQVQEV